MKNSHRWALVFILGLLNLAAVFFLLYLGETPIQLAEINQMDSLSAKIFWQLRLPKILAAILAGISLGLSGLILQTYFDNPLAGPYVLGIQGGASLMMALWYLGPSVFGFSLSSNFIITLGPIGISTLGCLIFFLAMIFFASKFHNKVVLLIIGLLLGHLVNGVTGIVSALGSSEMVKEMLMWNMGSFRSLSLEDAKILAGVVLLASIVGVAFHRTLDSLLLGESYAKTMGINLKRTRLLLLLIVSVLTGATTAFLGPLIFVGIMAPHISRYLFKTYEHRWHFLGVFLIGPLICLSVEFFSGVIFKTSLPVNALLSFGAIPALAIILTSREYARP